MSTELDLRGLHRDHEPDPAFVERLRLRLEGALDAAADGPELVDVDEVPLAPAHAPAARRRRRPALLAAAAVVVVGVVGALLWSQRRDGTDDATYTGRADAAFVGTWVSTDTDGSAQTLEIVRSEPGFEIVLRDDAAAACSGEPATVTGAGQVRPDGSLVVVRPVLVCADGSTPAPFADRPADVSFVHDAATDRLVDGAGGVEWRRAGVDDPGTATRSGAMWPQSSLAEVRDAQRSVDAGEPEHAWQVDAELASEGDRLDAFRGAELLVRFLREELGWESFLFTGGYAHSEGRFEDIEVFRCAPGETNRLYPEDPEFGTCAPTLDGRRYETVGIDIAQLDRRGPAGIWVVTRWETTAPYEQAVPPSDAEVTTLLQVFLEARVAGEGAEAYVGDGPVPLLYATTGGARYERFEFALLDGEPDWPRGDRVVRVRLFARGGETVVEQLLAVSRAPSGRVVLAASTGEPEPSVRSLTENGEPVAERHLFLGGEVAFAAPWPWSCCGSMDHDHGPTLSTLYFDSTGEGLALVADPRPVGTGCETGPAAADAAALARAIASDPDLDVTEPVAVRIGATEALQLDVAPAPGAPDCDGAGPAVLLTAGSTPGKAAGVWGARVRLYLLDAPLRSARVLALAVFTADDSLERVLRAATPVVDSLELDPATG